MREIFGDRRSLPEYAAVLQSEAPDVVLDMMAVFEEDALQLVQVFPNTKIVMISSMDVYRAYGRLIGAERGETEPLPITETSPLREKLYPYRNEADLNDEKAKWKYFYDKIPIERIILDTGGTVLRLPMVYGPDDYQRRLKDYVQPMKDGTESISLDDKTARWRTTRGYVEDVAAAIVLACESNKAGVYNVGEMEWPTEGEWLQLIADVLSWKGKLLIEKSEDEPQQDLVVSSQKIRDELGYAEIHSRAQRLRRSIEWELSLAAL